jgi:Lon protease-like protein
MADLAVFPLHTVLFPGGLLPLKVFEARYQDMTRDCLRDGTPFGVCLLKSGSEVAQPDEPAVPESVGCLAEIIDCDVQEFGLMHLRVRGMQRFRLLSHRTEPDGLLRGAAERLRADRPLEGKENLAKFGACAEVLERIVATLSERDPANLPFVEPFAFDDPTWVSNRLAEVLPISVRARQKLMEVDDAGARIDVVHHYMLQHQLL